MMISIKDGDSVKIGAPELGFRAYLAVSGGFNTVKKLGSRSMFVPVTQQSKIEKDDFLPVSKPSKNMMKAASRVRPNPALFASDTLEVNRGPEFQLLTKAQRKQLSQTVFKTEPNRNRMGILVSGDISKNEQLSTMLSKSILPGMVQITSSGSLMILLNDSQTTGGYPRILQLGKTALVKAAQMRPNTEFQFCLEE
jgi:allophanate hydrolase subunit 2